MSSPNLVPIKEGKNVIFYLNTGGYPLNNDVWDHMWSYAKELQPSASEKIEYIQKNKDKLPNVEVPVVPYSILSNKMISNSQKIEKIQNYIEKLQYNHTGLQFFEIRKDRPLMGLAELSKKMIEVSLPIKCLEAVILSIFLINEITLSNSLAGVEKFTIGFKTNSKGNVHRHVVLGVFCHSTGLFGALGISRRSDLGFKKLKYLSLTDLINDYVNCYSDYLHKVKRIKIGMPIPNSNRSFESIPWNGCTINLKDNKEWSKLVEKHSRAIRHFSSTFNSKTVSIPSLKSSGKAASFVRNSYLANHFEKNKVDSSLKALNKKEKSPILTCFEDDDDYEEDELSDSDKKNANKNKYNLEESTDSFTLIKEIRSTNRNINSVYSSGLVKRKQASLRI
ncbi:vasohibin-2 isoform X1 [Brachionus plicatilis]|uniref:Vasohibin-2 isoform X1 n=1 Tax=Brachionus plicatilis TaxID=10195 RepID=A0A3M7T8N4_BRAPC|nr:vasohibin-2 isoform X1 [Brachionus plicatilis]